MTAPTAPDVADASSPIPGPVAHVFVDRDDGVCVCGAARFTGLHVADDGSALPDLHGVEDQLDVITTAVEQIRARLYGVRP